VPRYRQLYRRGAVVAPEYRSWLAGRVAPLLARYGLDRQAGGAARGVDGGAPAGIPGDGDGDFPAGSLPDPRPTRRPVQGRPTGGPVGEQLTLL
jgi:hypothetical protein